MGDLRNHIQIDERDETLLYRQVEDGLRTMIGRMKFGDRIDSERKIAADLGVARVTARRAIQNLVDEGLLERRRKGTYVAGSEPEPLKPASSSSSSNGKYHPFSELGFPSLSEKIELSFSVYENRPRQRVCWERVVSTFNETNAGVTIDIRWLPLEIDAPSKYAAFAMDERIDVLQCSPCMRTVLSVAGALGGSIPELAELIGESNYERNVVENVLEPSNGTVVPVYFSSWLRLVNASWLKRRRSRFSADLSKPDGFDEALRSQSEDDNMRLCGSVWSWLVGKGLPDGENVDVAFFARRFERLAELLSLNPKMFLFEENPDWQSCGDFHADVLPFYCGPNPPVLVDVLEIPFEISGDWIQPEESTRLPGSTTCLGIGEASANQKAAVEFVRFCLSKVGQSIIASERIGCPINRSAAQPLIDGVPGSTLSNYHAAAAAFTAETGDFKRLRLLFHKQLRNEYRALANGTLTPSKMADIAVEKWEKTPPLSGQAEGL